MLNFRHTTIVLFSWVVCLRALPAHISVRPDTLVEVGEAVYLSAFESNTDTAGNQQDTFNWDFGDDYYLKYGYPNSNSMHNGASALHFYMRPGTFTVKLCVARYMGAKDSTTRRITVTGEQPLAGFEVWCAPIHARIAQYMYVQIPAAYRGSAASLTVTMSGPGAPRTLLQKSQLAAAETLLFRNADLDSGSYVLVFELFNGSGSRASILREKFNKPYYGAPHIAFNENNAICVDGQPFFPVTPWMLGDGWFPYYGKTFNCTYSEGAYDVHNVAATLSFLNACRQNGYYMIGPGGRWDGAANNLRSTNPLKAIPYVTSAAQTNPYMLMWMWKDEPNLGGRNTRTPVEVMGAMQYICHHYDPIHPVATNLYGQTYVDYYGPAGSYLDYDESPFYFGGKKHLCFEMTGFDIYPIAGANHASMTGRPRIAQYLKALDFLRTRNYGLVPYMTFIEVQKINIDTLPPPTASQVMMLAWSSVIHGCKGINWFHKFYDRLPEVVPAMKDFNDEIKVLGKVVLGTPPAGVTVADNADSGGQRVDCMVREDSNNFYVFAVRVTEPSFTAFGAQEPDSLPVHFTLTGTPANNQATSIGKLEEHVYERRPATGESAFALTIGPAPIVPGSVVLSVLRVDNYRPWMYLFDNGTGLLQGETGSGTINYQTGLISATFPSPAVTGDSSILLIYDPVRTPRTMAIASGQFTDTFKRDAYHIYKIPKNPVAIQNPRALAPQLPVVGPAIYYTVTGRKIGQSTSLPNGIYLMQHGVDGPLRKVMVLK